MNYPVPHKQKGRKIYFFYAEVEGKRRHLSTGQTTRADANAYIRRFFDQHMTKGYTQKTFREYSSIYYIWGTCPKVARAINEGKSMGESHVSQYRRNLDKYILTDPIFPYLKMVEIKRKDILDLRERLKEPLASKVNTLNKTISSVKAIMAEAHYREDIESDPGSKIGNLKEDRTTRDILAPEELKVLFQQSPGFWDDEIGYDFFFVLANTGMRSGELRALKWDKWDFNNKIIRVHRSWKGNKSEILGLPKWDKIRDIPVSSVVANILEKQPRYGEFIFSYPNGRHLGYTWVNKRARTSLKRSTLLLTGRSITAHCLRHSVNTYLLSMKVNPVFIQAYLGWSKDSALTRVQEGYTHFAPEHIRECPNTISEIWQGGQE